MKKKSILFLLLILLCFFTALSRLDTGRQEQGRQQLEEAVRRTAVSCYALEGRYPPDIAYLRQHYGVQISEADYIVHYEIFAENIMPEITVLER